MFLNLRYWKCDYCGLPIKDNVPFGIIKISGESEPEIFCTKSCLKIYILKMESKRMAQ